MTRREAVSVLVGRRRGSPPRRMPAAARLSADTGGELGCAENFAVEHEIGHRFRFDPASLPPPGLQPSASNGPRTAAYAGQGLTVPPGFAAAPFATGIRNPRRLLLLEMATAGRATERGRHHAAAMTRAGRRSRASATPAASTSHMGWRGRETRCWSPTRTAFGGLGPRCAALAGYPQGRVRGRSRPRKPADCDRPEDRCAVHRDRLDGQYRGRAGAEGDDPAFRPGRFEPDQFIKPTRATRRRWRSIRKPANCGPGSGARRARR